MYPESRDNYGCESCSILCLHPISPSPPVLVIANNSGILYHCIVLTKEENLDDWSLLPTSKKEPNLTLYVFESVELDIGMLHNANVSSDRLFDHPLVLNVDPSCPARYFCSHRAGVHCVALPIMSRLAEFAQVSEGSKTECFNFGENDSLVEHLICTQMSGSAEPHPILGISIRSPPTTLYCLLNDCKIEQLMISGLQFDLPLPEPQGEQGDRHLLSSGTDSFEQKIRSMLKKDTNIPLIKASGSTPSTKECLEVVKKSTKVANNLPFLKSSNYY